MTMPHAARKPYLATSNLDIPKPGPGKAARAWVNSLAGLSRGERAVALAFAWYSDAEGYCWPSRYSVAVRSAYTVRSVQSLTETLVARGVLIEAGTKTTRDKHGGAIKRTRLYRLALGVLVPVMPATERRRLARELDGENAKIALSIGADDALSRVQKLHSELRELVAVESEKIALSRPVESAKIAHNPKNNPGDAVGAPADAPPTGAGAPPTGLSPTSNLTGAAREPAGPLPELTPAEVLATAERRRLALTPKGGRWWDVLPVALKSAHDRPNRLGGDRKDWRRGAKA